MVVYLVRSFGLMPESVSHDWHVQPSCQRPNRGPPERREFSPGELARVRIRLSSKPYKHTVRRKILSIDASHRISRRFPHRERRGSRRAAWRKQVPHDKAVRNDNGFGWERLRRALEYAQQYGLPVGVRRHFRRMPIRKTRN